MNAPALVNIQIPSLQMAEDELVRVLESSLYPGAKLESIKLVVGYCKSQNLDPMLKPVHIVPMSVKKADGSGYEMRDTIMPGIGLYRTIASRTGEYAGITEPEFGPAATLQVGDFKFEHPAWCKVTVYREVNGTLRTFAAKEFWIENYATKGRDSAVPNAMWHKRPMGQLAKCTEAQALRKAFSEVPAQPTLEEMEGKTLDTDGVTIEGSATHVPHLPAVEQPQSRSGADPKPEPAKEKSKADAAPMSAGMKKTILTQMAKAALSEIDLHARFGHDADGALIEGWTIDSLTFADVNAVLAWVKNPTGQ